MRHAAKAPGGLRCTLPGGAPSRRGLGHGDKRDATDLELGAWTLAADAATVAALTPLPIAVLVGPAAWALVKALAPAPDAKRAGAVGRTLPAKWGRAPAGAWDRYAALVAEDAR